MPPLFPRWVAGAFTNIILLLPASLGQAQAPADSAGSQNPPAVDVAEQVLACARQQGLSAGFQIQLGALGSVMHLWRPHLQSIDTEEMDYVRVRIFGRGTAKGLRWEVDAHTLTGRAFITTSVYSPRPPSREAGALRRRIQQECKPVEGATATKLSGAHPSGEQDPTVMAGRFVAGALSDSSFRRQPCVLARSGDCPGGVHIVRGYRLGQEARAGDTIRVPVEYQVIGTVGVSEAAPFFMPRSWADSGKVLLIRSGNGWVVRLPRDSGGEPVRTIPDVARRYFDLDDTDRKLLDSAAAVPGRQ
jgi:hypothetical protein